ncbi:hypothetical protein DSM03_1011220 [Leeuwenhoekiella aestuarii]|uniref:Uncharacterized protein n=1 Tax=Leeuwenhoekiella aestuarii TaxID=2249426 RepID=A0A4Q0P2U1_9FLAO|nr:hypothetical protein [Leeuwenhoekiella aestuarii]RXG18529.1 hypothetical protein DSM04_101731 [Leeuwenhoekiella aestuarii]RXG19834.1 hypothetical protein DSM03_1011220 [Leeuwenhoekiella aestuarii]
MKNGDLIEEEVFKINRSPNFLNNEKINCTYNQLVKQHKIIDLLKDFFGEDAFDVVFNLQENFECNGGTDAVGCTTPLGNNSYAIDIDADFTS